MTNDLALQQLQALVAIPGALKIITNAHRCQDAIHPDFPGFDAATCAAYGEEIGSRERFGANPLADPRHFVCHDVVRLEGPDDKGRYKAFSANDEDWCLAYPAELLERLQEATRAGA